MILCNFRALFSFQNNLGRKVQNPFFLQGSSLRKHMASFEAIADNFIENIGIIRRKTGSDDIDAKICKYYAVDCISKVD